MKKYLLAALSVLFLHFANAQMMGMGGGFKGGANVGHFYGKVVDSITGKAVPFAAVQISGQKWDTVSKSMKDGVLAGQLTGDNGEFNLDKLPIMGALTLQISSIGYRPYTRTVYFDLKKLMNGAKKMRSQQGGDGGDGEMPSGVTSMVDAIDKDLGNLRLAPDATQLKAVTVDGSTPPMEIKLDKKVFDVSKNLTTSGGTAEDVLKSIPAVNVDIDGNVTLRNASPTIYVDGMPTNLTIDQIPADEIDKIEVITNPSAKYDASASTGGIINIVMKKNRKLGYNGSIRAGVDERGKMNGGLDLNVRQKKLNVFGDLFYHQIDHRMYGKTTRDNLIGSPLTDITQYDTNKTDGHFMFARAGVDYFIDNRNTLTVSGMMGKGDFQPQDYLSTNTDSLSPVFNSSNSYRNSASHRTFGFTGGDLLYKHLFPKDEETLTANAEMDQGKGDGSANYATQEYDANHNPLGAQILQQQQSTSVNNELNGQVDYSDPITKKITFQTGARVSTNQVTSQSSNFSYDNVTGEYVNIQSLNSDYSFSQQVYAGYVILSQQIGTRFGYEAGLREESSFYSGKYADSATGFKNQYPLSLFPSAYLTYHLTDKSDLQLNYSRHVSRPSFHQLVPYTDYSDSLNIKQGNPDLRPQFMNSFEFNYLNNFNRKNTFMFSLYYKNTTGLITSYQKYEYSTFLNKEVPVNTYVNANQANSYGAEITSQNSIGRWLDITSNLNLYQSNINASNLPDTNQITANSNLISWYAKLNLTFKLPWNIDLELNNSYQSKSVIPVDQGEGRWGHYGMSSTPTSQGYILPTYTTDIAIKKDFLKNKALSVNLNVKDVFATSVNATSTSLSAYNQTTSRRRDSQFFRLTISYRFGQADFTLFKKKNMNQGGQPQDVNGGEDM